MNSAALIWHNGRLKPWQDATCHVSAHALHYGSSVFEGERVYATAVGPAYFRLADHTRRLFESAKVYEIDIGYSEDEINAACLELIRANQMSSAYVRPIVFRGAGGLGVLAKPGSPVDVAIMNLPGLALYGGTIAHGTLDGKSITIQDVFEAVGAHGAGKLSDQKLGEIERRACPGAGACGGQFTANTMALILTALGLSPLGANDVPATHPDKRSVAYRCGELVMILRYRD